FGVLHAQARIAITLIIRELKVVGTFGKVDITSLVANGAATAKLTYWFFINRQTKAVITGNNKLILSAFGYGKRNVNINKKIIAVTYLAKRWMFKTILFGDIQYIYHNFFSRFDIPVLLDIFNADLVFADHQFYNRVDAGRNNTNYDGHTH